MRIVHADQLAQGVVDVGGLRLILLGGARCVALLADDVAAVVIFVVEADARLSDGLHQGRSAVGAVATIDVGVGCGLHIRAAGDSAAGNATQIIVVVTHLLIAGVVICNLRNAIVIVIGVAGTMGFAIAQFLREVRQIAKLV